MAKWVLISALLMTTSARRHHRPYWTTFEQGEEPTIVDIAEEPTSTVIEVTSSIIRPPVISQAAVSDPGDSDESTIDNQDVSSRPNQVGTSAKDCKCGYIVSAHSDAYFPLSHTTTFSSLPDDPVSSSALKNLGWIVSEWGVGGAGPEGTRSIGTIDTLSIENGILSLTVPGGQQKGGNIDAAEITFDTPNGVTGGVFTMQAQLDETPGTCQSIFTYRKDNGRGDEQDIEVLGRSIFQKSGPYVPGVQLTNWDPSGSGKNAHKVVAFPEDPTTAFHNYTIAWLPSEVKYSFDDQPLAGPPGYPSVNPSNVMINHWSNGDEGFTAGPPTSDVVMRVKGVTLYYQTPGLGLPSGCSKEDACRV